MPVACVHTACSHSQYTVLHAPSNLLVTMVIKPCQRPSSSSMPWSMEIIGNQEFFDISLFLGVGVPPCQRHPQLPSFTQTSMPKYDPFFKPLLSIITFQEMTIKHFMYMQKAPFLYTERACVVFFQF